MLPVDSRQCRSQREQGGGVPIVLAQRRLERGLRLDPEALSNRGGARDPQFTIDPAPTEFGRETPIPEVVSSTQPHLAEGTDSAWPA